ncbi:F-box domain-containing protein [Mycena sanguinolenta]|uniref:F-box domain-containing protein n=1 Tax=Mycena sanguinolenta TaxID=230812 RepID=A0A8H7D4J5_9AGAR|nr:F-box domain-containing protein [Mycena sanguinolenta]
MSSIQTLRARLEKISSEIVLQEKLLDQLRHEKTLAQRQLNAAVDPVARLPLEISSEIFLQCLAPFPEKRPAGDCAPLLLLNICSTWSAIALSTPRLWSAVAIDFYYPEALTQLLPTWLKRAGKHPLSISLRGDFHSHHIPTIVWLYREQLKELEIVHEEDDRGSHDSEDEGLGILDLFGNATPEPLPLLETLIFCNEAGYRGLPAPQILRLLRLAPNLVNYTHTNSFLKHFGIPSEKPMHSTLRTLTFGGRDNPPAPDEGILACLLFPALTDLAVDLHMPGCSIFAFLKQQPTPALRGLVLGMTDYDTPDSVELHECLHLIPSLMRFQMWYPMPHYLVHICTNLTDSSSFLPNLDTLSIHLSPFYDSDWDSVWGSLLRAVSTRRIELQIEIFEKPPEDILAAFAELAARGAKICIRSDSGEYYI